MSISTVQSAKPSVLDLLPVKQASGGGSADRFDSGNQANESGFERVLRDASAKRGADKPGVAETREATGRGETEVERTAGDSEAVSRDRAEKPDTDSDQGAAESSQKGAEKTQDNGEDAQAVEGQDAAAEGEVDAEAQSLAAQGAANVQALAGQAQSTNTNVNAAIEGESEGESSHQQQSQAVLQQAAAAANKPGQSQANTTQTQTAAATAVQPLQQEDTAQSKNSGTDARGEGSASAQATTATQPGNAHAAATTAFSVPDQVSSEARLPVNPAGNVQHAESAKAAQTQTMMSTNDNDAVNTARLTRGMANAVQQRGGAVTLRLTPPEMGTVRIQMQITGTNVSASFHAESASAQTLLTQQLSQLRSALESQGMNVEKLSVQPMASTAQSSNANQNHNNNSNDNQQQAQQQSANDGRSRGQYSGDTSGRSSGRDGDGDGRSQQQARRGFFDQLNDSADAAA